MATKRLPETPIERIFQEVMGQTMPRAVKRVLLSKEYQPDILDYPGSMSQWEKESLAAEARLGTSAKRKSNRRQNVKG